MKTSVNRKQRPQTSGNHLFQNPIARYFRLNGLVLVLLVTAWNCTSESEVSQVSPPAYSVQINALQAGRSAHFIAETDRPGFWVVEATWEFGDGNGSQALSPSHVYSEPGRYTILLNAQTNVGEEKTLQLEITVDPPESKSASWIWQGVTTTTNHIQDLDWNGQNWVAVGDRGEALISRDGLDWEFVDTQRKEDLLGLTWTGSRFLAVGRDIALDFDPLYKSTGVLLASTEGQHWSALSRDERAPSSAIVFGKGICLSITSRYRAASDPRDTEQEVAELLILNSDQKWEKVLANNQLHGLSWDGTRFWLTSITTPNYDTNPEEKVLTSEDGINWQDVPGFPYGFDARSFARSESRIVAIGTRIASSPDGVEWTIADTGTAEKYRDLAWSDGRFVAVGTHGSMLTSKDGQNWEVLNPITNGTLNTVAFNGILWLAGGEYGTLLWSTDGLEWHASEPNTPPTDEDLVQAFGDHHGFLAIGGNQIFSSDDGMDWSAETVNADSLLHAVTRTVDGIFVLASSSSFPSEIWHLNSGQWHRVFQSTDMTFRAMAHLEGKWVCTGISEWILFSEDGKLWTPLQIEEPGIGFRAVSAIDGQFYALSNRLLHSQDGKNWVAEEDNIYFDRASLAGNSSSLVIGGMLGLNIPQMQSRMNGNPWQQYVYPQSGAMPYSLFWSGDRFLAAGDMAETTYSLQNRNEAVNALYESVDGLNWQAISSPHVPRIRSMAKSRDWLIAVGDKGTILRHPLNP